MMKINCVTFLWSTTTEKIPQQERLFHMVNRCSVDVIANHNVINSNNLKRIVYWTEKGEMYIAVTYSYNYSNDEHSY